MPLRGTGHSKVVGNDAPYFGSLAELDAWAAVPAKKLTGVLGFQASRPIEGGLESEHSSKLLVCHDYKGGYRDQVPSALSYTFNFWSYCDTFVYFSHHRVTVPPSGWTTAAHRQGVKMLGTLIFEDSGEEDCLRLLVGQLPKSKTGPALPSSTTLPLSPHYARVLADLAQQRGFDGYLLNFECPLRGGLEQTRALAGWIAILQSELKAKVGPHAQAIWYDSVIFTGHLRWQDRLNSLNLPFFLSSAAIFTNYTWPPHYPSLSAQYFLSLDPAIVGSDISNKSSAHKAKTLRDIYTGVDVWGRGSHGGGGFGCYKAINHIDPKFLGLSVALFGQAWTWESEQDKPGWSWEKWWNYERTMWLGPQKEGEEVPVPDTPRRDGEPECPHGKFEPLVSFFPQSPPPNPADLPFYTSFGVGVGRAWFVEGVKVLQTEDGWTDIDKQCSLGNMVWPRPILAWENDERKDKLPDASSALNLDNAWNGGNSLLLTVSGAGSDADDAFFRCVWLPVQSLAITPRLSYEAHVVYKVNSSAHLDLDLGLSVKLLTDNIQRDMLVNPIAVNNTDHSGGWTTLCIQFELPTDCLCDVLVAIGLVIGFAAEDPTEAYEFSILLGQITVFPTSTRGVSVQQPKLLWADFESTPTLESKFSGVLTWEVAASYTPLTNIAVTSPEDPNPVWILDASDKWFSGFLYFNIYAQPYTSDGIISEPETAVFIGTTGLHGHAQTFFVDPNCVPQEITHETKGARYLVQGVTDRGEVLKWVQCVFVDVIL